MTDRSWAWPYTLTDNIIFLSHTHSSRICDQNKLMCRLITVIGTIRQLSSPPSCDYGNDTEGEGGERAGRDLGSMGGFEGTK